MVIIGQKTSRYKRIDTVAQLKASVLKAHGREDGPQMEVTAGARGEPNAGDELAELEAPPRALLEECLCNTRSTKRVAARLTSFVIGSNE